MPYKYFKHPKRFVAFHDDAITCQICKEKKNCLDASPFYGEDELEAVCEDCLNAGRLTEIGACTIDADTEMLVKQLEELYPNWTKKELFEDAKAKTDELELRTPPILSWQEWKYPAADGDYCQFIGFASKQDYERLALLGEEEMDGKTFFARTLYDTFAEDTNVDGIWKSMADRKIKNVAQSNDYFLLVYLFKSLHSETYVSVWDIC